MNDRFKFRVYFKGSDYAKAGYQVTRKYVIYSLDTNGKLIRDCIYECRQEGHEGSPCHIPFVHDNNDMYVVQFCTGLKDKNGKLIYEGDIVKYTSLPSKQHKDERIKPSTINFKVVWVEKYAQYQLQNAANVNCIHISTAINQLEVIGNIYENPELLEVK